ncbi:MAG: carbohydrate-binding protein [Rhodothermales bacterium]
MSSNTQVDNPDGSTPVSGTTARITLENYEGTEQGLPVYSAYAYAFGTIDVSSSAHGGYNASLQLRAEPVFNVPPICLSDEWNPNRRYRAGDSVTYDGAAWEANRRTRGDEPGAWPGGGDDDDDEDEDEDDDDEEDDEDGGGSRITICHIPPGNPGNQQTMTVSRNALSVHLGHGDHEGPCLGDGDGDDDDGFGPGSPWDLITTCP